MKVGGGDWEEVSRTFDWLDSDSQILKVSFLEAVFFPGSGL